MSQKRQDSPNSYENLETLHKDITDPKTFKIFHPKDLNSMRPVVDKPMTYPEYLEKYVLTLPHTESELKTLYKSWNDWQQKVCTELRYTAPAVFAAFVWAITVGLVLGLIWVVFGAGSVFVGLGLGELLTHVVTGKSYSQSVQDSTEQSKGTFQDAVPESAWRILGKVLPALFTSENSINRFIITFMSPDSARLLLWSAPGFAAALIYLFKHPLKFRLWMRQSYIGAYAYVVDRCRHEEKEVDLDWKQMYAIYKDAKRLKIFQEYTPEFISGEEETKTLRGRLVKYFRTGRFKIHPMKHGYRTGKDFFSTSPIKQ